MSTRATSFDVRVWGVSKRTWASGVVTYRVRWIVAGHMWHDSFKTRALADSFRSELLSLARRGEPFESRPDSRCPGCGGRRRRGAGTTTRARMSP